MTMMKKHIRGAAAISLIALMGLGSLSSCTAGFEEANRPGNATSAEELGRDNYTVGSFLVQMQNAVFPEQENAYQMDEDLIGNYLGRYFTYVNHGFNSANFATMNAPAGWVNWPFKNITPKFVLAFKEIERLGEGRKDINYAWALILRAQGYLRLTDKYGPFPIGLEKDANAYSSQEAIYNKLIADLDEASEVLKTAMAGNEGLVVSAMYDKVYGGKMANWRRFAHSLKLRMAIRMRFADPEKAKKYGEEAVAAGVIEQNDQNCTIAYVPLGLHKTSVEWGDSRACADIESYMNGYNDPRLTKYFKDVEKRPAGGRAIVGCRAGAKIGNKSVATPIYSAANVETNTRGVWLTAAEMAFCRAEGAMAGWANMGRSAREWYEEGIRLSFKQWGAGDASEYIWNGWRQPGSYNDAEGGFGSNAPAVSNITVMWQDNDSEERKLERLIVQKWIALFPDGQEAWNEIRRTGYPKVFPVEQGTGSYNMNVPNRIPFSSTEITENPENLEKAKLLLGGKDDYATMMWWQRAKHSK